MAPLAAAKQKQGKGKFTHAKRHWVFPVRGPHDYGDLSVTGFGAMRSDGSRHTGQDVIAKCGTPLDAVHDARVLSSGYSPGTGNYVALDGLGSRLDFVYDHLKRGRLPRKGARLRKGQRIGFVGKSATTVCHLHFEIWKGLWL
ncbi:MAG: murein hydrolase activator EnvC family protein, partial [Solirubrobacterales bacterium]